MSDNQDQTVRDGDRSVREFFRDKQLAYQELLAGAFLQACGLDPRECQIVQQREADGSVRIWYEAMTDKQKNDRVAALNAENTALTDRITAMLEQLESIKSALAALAVEQVFVTDDPAGNYRCPWCYGGSATLRIEHSPDCPYVRARAILNSTARSS